MTKETMVLKNQIYSLYQGKQSYFKMIEELQLRSIDQDATYRFWKSNSYRSLFGPNESFQDLFARVASVYADNLRKNL